MAFDVTGLSAYVRENNDLLLSKAILGAETLEVITIQTGVKYQDRIHLLAVDPTIQAASCSFSANGTATFTQRTITAPALKIDMNFCPEDMLGKYGEWEVNHTAGRETLPFEEKLMNEITKKVSRKIEDLVWMGSAALSVSGITEFVKEFVDFSTGASVGSSGNWASVTSVAGAYSAILAVYGAIPVEVLDEAMIFVSEGTYRSFIQALVAANLYHFEPAYGDRSYPIPGTTTVVKAAPGLGTTKYILAASPKNLFWGCDLENGHEIFDLWYSRDNEQFRFNVKFNGGAQVAFPDQVIVGKVQ